MTPVHTDQLPTNSADESNPYRAPSDQSAPPRLDGDRPLSWLRGLLLLQCVTVVIAALASFGIIESVIPSGIVSGILALFLTALAIRCRHMSAVWLGLSNIVLVVTLFLVVNVYDWSPGYSRPRVPWTLVVYAVVHVPFGVAAMLANPVDRFRRSQESPELRSSL